MTDTIEAVARAIANASAEAWENWGIGTDPADWRDEAQAAIKALVEGAGELKRFEPLDMGSDFVMCDHEQGDWVRYDQAAATIAAQKAEIERLTEREAQAKLDGVRVGIEAALAAMERGALLHRAYFVARDSIRALDAEAIAKGE